MSDAITIARPYAKAAFQYAVEKKSEKTWVSTLNALSKVASDANLIKLLQDPKVTQAQVAQVLLDICKDHLDESGNRFVNLLAEKGRLDVIPEISEIFETLYADSLRAITAQVFSPFELDAQQREGLRHALQKRLDLEVSIETHIDETLIGGVLIRAGDLVIDGTLRGQLDRLRDELMNS